jgi:formylglycine-generating enzyme required for sulfatase activity
MPLAIGAALMLTSGFISADDCPSQKYKRSSQTPIVKDMVNPGPSENDFELPMPCGGKLILRHVCIPAKSLLDDFQFNLGCEDCRRQDEGFMEAKRITTIAGAFTLEDLPEPWSIKLIEIAESGDGRCPVADDENSNALYYFIGKYEISTWQWQTVMQSDCPGWDQPFKIDDPRPKTNISWFEAVEFTRRYTEWLLKNNPDTLPKFPDGRIAYIRLPTEAEWEYAARGGHRVSANEINHEVFFPLNNRPFADYAVYTLTGAAKPPDRLAWIGTRCPNPLGLFDTAGNAAEMMLDPFQFSIGSRLHGATGGFVIKGGSYLKSRAEIMPGRREEMPYFLENEAFRSNDLGFRVVLSGIVSPQNRIQALRQNWAEISRWNQLSKPSSEPSKSRLDLDRSESFVRKIEGLSAAAGDEAEKQEFQAIADYIKNIHPILAEKEADAINAVIWEALFAAESLVNYTGQREQSQHELEILKNLKTQPIPETDIESLNRNIFKLMQHIDHCNTVIDYFLQSYIDSIRNSQKFSKEAIYRQINLILQNKNLEEILQSSMNGRLEVLRDHVSLYSENPESIQQETIIKDIVSVPP